MNVLKLKMKQVLKLYFKFVIILSHKKACDVSSAMWILLILNINIIFNGCFKIENEASS